jgi:MFS family permease
VRPPLRDRREVDRFVGARSRGLERRFAPPAASSAPTQFTGSRFIAIRTTARRFFPATATRDARLLVVARALRGFADGMVSVLLADYLTHLGFSSVRVAAIVTGTLLGSAALTLFVGVAGDRLGRRNLLLAAAALMLATGVGFAGTTSFWPLLMVAIVGTLNPSSGDVSVFLPTEQGVLSGAVAGSDRTSLFAWYSVAGAFAASLGALASAVPVLLARRQGWELVAAERSAFILYALVALVTAALYRTLSPEVERQRGHAKAPPLARSRGIVLRLSALFCIDSFGGGFIVQSLLVLWLHRRFDLSVTTAGAVFFVTGLLSALSQFVSPWLARRFGLVRTMVFTHLPSNGFLILAGVMPNAALAILFLSLRALLSQMDVPARQSFVMSVVPPEERAAAASVTNVPRSLAAGLSPMVAGLLLDRTSFGWPLILAGCLKAAYDVLLLVQFQAVKPLDDPVA